MGSLLSHPFSTKHISQQWAKVKEMKNREIRLDKEGIIFHTTV
jgi:hypothetical protein